MRDEMLPFSPPFLGEAELEEVVAALRSGWISRGPRTRRFEEEFARYVGVGDALALNSCTAGLHLALVASGIGAGDEVIVPAMTFAASANVVEHVGARPVLVDVEPDTLNLDPALLDGAVTERTRAVMAVHYGGHPAAMDEIETWARARGILVIEDAAHALGARYRGRRVGEGDNLVAFSFYATKNLTTGEGGMLTGGDAEALRRARVLSLHGMSGDAWNRYSGKGSWYYEVVEPGFKYNMTDVQAALGLVQLARLDRMQERRRRVAELYGKALAGLRGIALPSVRAEVEPAWHLFPIRVDRTVVGLDRDTFIERLRERNISTSVHFIPLHRHPYYRERYGYRPETFPVANRAFEELISLPLHPGLEDRDVHDVVEAIGEVAGL